MSLELYNIATLSQARLDRSKNSSIITSFKRLTSEGEEGQQANMSRVETRDFQRAFPHRAITERRRVPAWSELSCLQTRSQVTHLWMQLNLYRDDNLFI